MRSLSKDKKRCPHEYCVSSFKTNIWPVLFNLDDISMAISLFSRLSDTIYEGISFSPCFFDTKHFVLNMLEDLIPFILMRQVYNHVYYIQNMLTLC